MYKRTLTQQVIQGLTHNSAVAILGPRQVGKTTLAHIVSEDKDSIYLDLENLNDMQKLENPVHYMALHAKI